MRPTALSAFHGVRPACIALAALLCALPTPALALDLPTLRSDRPPYFSADLAISLDRDQKPGLSISITVPYQELEWVRFDGPGGTQRFGAGVEFTVIFETGRGEGLGGDAWERRMVVAEFSQTR